jgi:Predicted nucleotidyltransferase
LKYLLTYFLNTQYPLKNLNTFFTAKKLWELIEPCQIRKENVLSFLQDIDPSLEYDIVSITDIFGPTKDDPTFEVMTC